MSYGRVYFSVEVAQFLLDLTKNSDWWQSVAIFSSSSGLWAQRPPVDGTPSPHLGLDTLRPQTSDLRPQPQSHRQSTVRMGLRESKPEKGLSNEDIAFLLKNTNLTKKEIKVRPDTDNVYQEKLYRN